MVKKALLVLILILFTGCNSKQQSTEETIKQSDSAVTIENKDNNTAKEAEKKEDCSPISEDEFKKSYPCLYEMGDYDRYMKAIKDTPCEEYKTFHADIPQMEADECEAKAESERVLKEMKEALKPKDFSGDKSYDYICKQTDCFVGHSKPAPTFVFNNNITIEWGFISSKGVIVVLKSHLTQALSAAVIKRDIELREILNGNFIQIRIKKTHLGEFVKNDQVKDYSSGKLIYPEDSFVMFFEIDKPKTCKDYVLFNNDLGFTSFVGVTTCGSLDNK